MDPLPAPAIALLAAMIARAWMAHDDRARARPQVLVRGDGWVTSRLVAGVPLADWAWGIGAMVVMLGIIVMGIVSILIR